MKTRNLFKYLLSIVLLIILLGCSKPENLELPMPQLTEHQAVNTLAPVIPSTFPLTITPSNEDIIPICNGSGRHILVSNDFGISGTIIYQNDDNTGLYSMGGIPLIQSQLLSDETQNHVFGFSPDGQWLVYSPFDTSSGVKYKALKVILMSAEGKKIERVLSTKEFEAELQTDNQLVGISGYYYWINQQMIYITLLSQNPDIHKSGTIDENSKILDPFAGEWNNQFLDLPGRFLSGEVGISPDKSRALYQETGLSLWDYDRKIRIWHDESLISPFRALIKWSSDSSEVAYANLYNDSDNQTVLLITRDGEIIPIINKTFPLPGFKILDISWSPNGQYLALVGRGGEKIELLIYNKILRKYVSQCPIASAKGVLPPLIWSPDGSYIAISDIDSPILITSVMDGKVYQFAQHGIVLGWSDKFPVILP
ncbi:MAG: WD40 repeat domain-containing protein [Chloroflexota bacterium]